jgi:hypothetical protein
MYNTCGSLICIVLLSLMDNTVDFSVACCNIIALFVKVLYVFFLHAACCTITTSVKVTFHSSVTIAGDDLIL